MAGRKMTFPPPLGADMRQLSLSGRLPSMNTLHESPPTASTVLADKVTSGLGAQRGSMSLSTRQVSISADAMEEENPSQEAGAPAGSESSDSSTHGGAMQGGVHGGDGRRYSVADLWSMASEEDLEIDDDLTKGLRRFAA